MGIIYGGTFPVLPGKEERLRRFASELEPNRDEWARLCKEGTYTRAAILLQPTPAGTIATYVHELDDPAKRRDAFTDSAYDRWWVGLAKDVHGIDLSAMPAGRPPPAETVFQWSAP